MITIRSFRDLPLWVKVLIAPAVCLSTGAVVAASIWLGATATEGRLAEVANVALPTAAVSAQLLDDIDTIEAKAMRALVWQQAGVAEATIDALVADIGHRLSALRANTAGMVAARGNGDANLPRLKAIADKSAGYAKQLGDALDLVADPAIAVGLFRRTDATFEALRSDISSLSAAHRAAEATLVQAARGSSHASLVRSYWIVGGSAVIMMILLPVLVTAIGRPVRALTRAMTDLAAGNMAAEIGAQDQRDELGDMARAVLVFREHMVRASQFAAEQEAERREAEAAKRAALVSMAATIEAATGSALRQIGERTTAMVSVADAMSASATRTGSSAQDAAAAAAQALEITRTAADAAEQLAGSIREIGGQVSLSTAAVGRAVSAGAETRSTIDTLNQEVKRIGAVADIIGEIAGRTNLLALNATIEAARAGDAGKGFAVVASEVKQLAMQTARSTEEISHHIAQVQSATGASVAAVTRIEQTIAEISSIASSIATAVKQQDAAAAAIARNMSDNAGAANAMTGRTTEASHEAAATGRSATDLRDNTAALNAAVEELRHSVIKVVRTSTAEVERRQFQRQPVDLPGRLSIAGQADCSVRITDLSEGGACLQGASSVPAGAHGTLRLHSVGTALRCSVQQTDGEQLHLAFDPDKAATMAVRSLLDRLHPAKAA